MSKQQRKCWDCGNVAMHADNIVPWVLCTKCGSQDTRLVRKPELPPTHPSRCEQELTAAQQRVAELERVTKDAHKLFHKLITFCIPANDQAFKDTANTMRRMRELLPEITE